MFEFFTLKFSFFLVDFEVDVFLNQTPFCFMAELSFLIVRAVVTSSVTLVCDAL